MLFFLNKFATLVKLCCFGNPDKGFCSGFRMPCAVHQQFGAGLSASGGFRNINGLLFGVDLPVKATRAAKCKILLEKKGRHQD